MKNKHSNRVWYVYSCDAHTNRIVFLELNPYESMEATVEDVDFIGQKVNKTLNLAQLRSYDEVQLLKRSQKTLRIKFKIFIQDSPEGKIYRWPFDNEVSHLVQKAKSH